MLRKMLVRSVVGMIFFGLVLFLPAGTIAWPQGWVFLVLFSGCSLATGIWLQMIADVFLKKVSVTGRTFRSPNNTIQYIFITLDLDHVEHCLIQNFLLLGHLDS